MSVERGKGGWLASTGGGVVLFPLPVTVVSRFISCMARKGGVEGVAERLSVSVRGD